MLDTILDIGPKMYNFCKELVKVDMRRTELCNALLKVDSKVKDMEQDIRNKEVIPGKKRKKVMNAYLEQVKRYKASAGTVLDGSHERQWILKRMTWVPTIQRHYEEGQKVFDRGTKLQEEGLTYDEDRMRGEMLPVDKDQYIWKTFSEHLESALKVMKDGSARCIGIHGYSGSGKYNLMKRLYNKVLEEEENFKAVFWATAPEPDNCSNYNKALQKCVADGMRIDLDNNDEVRSAGRIMARLEEIGTGCAVFFLDNLKKEFPAYELLGIPSQPSKMGSVKCILVFNTLSKDVCNRMQCDHPLKMELLERGEAQELFLHEVNRGNNDDQVFSYHDDRIQNVAVEVADECARMPLAIIVVARSMARIKDHREWNHRLNELKGTISSIHDEEDKIIECLKCGYFCLEDSTVMDCFLNAASLFGNNRPVSKVDIIKKWKTSGLIGRNRHADDQGHTTDQGHTVLNQLERACLLQVEPGNQTVSMNKWICKMAQKVQEFK